ncbi:MAG: class I SAM-dependent methyltransferase [Anaerolineales bacterium]|nr:class I SAM-dependent methyltransferase [Anaerolineales bacterium]
MTGDKIELLSVDLLDENRASVEALKRFARALRLEFGWHYLLDLSWILSHLGQVKGQRIMDAGAGVGVLQWRLASQGAEVISVDRLSRAALSLRYRRRFRVQGLRPEDLLLPGETLKSRFVKEAERGTGNAPYRSGVVKLRAAALEVFGWMHPPQGDGRVLIYNQDLAELSDLHDASMDAVVSVSALEHNSPEGLERVVKEIMRVLKPGGQLLATLTASGGPDWWHEPSSGWCYSEDSLRRLFDLSPGSPSNYSRYDEFFEALRNCAELRDNLASFYANSNASGMPQGIWNPQYQPVGVCKIKSQENL